MPQFGLKQATELPDAVPVDRVAAPPLPWRLTAAEVVQVTFEVDLDEALSLLPERLARPVPPYARIIVARYPESPVGPYAEALLLLAARYMMLPKNYVVAAVVTAAAARTAYEGFWGLPTALGAVELRRERNADGTEEIVATVAAETPLATLHLPGAYAVEPAMARYDPLVTALRQDGEPQVVQFSGTPAVHEARLAKGATATCHTDAWADPWFRLRSLNMISAIAAVADLELTVPMVLRSGPGTGMGGSA